MHQGMLKPSIAIFFAILLQCNSTSKTKYNILFGLTHPLSSLFSLHLPFLCLLAWWLCCHGWWISRSTTTRLVVVFLWVFLGGCRPMVWWVCLVVAGFAWWMVQSLIFDRCWWVFGMMGLIGAVVVDGLMDLWSVMGLGSVIGNGLMCRLGVLPMEVMFSGTFSRSLWLRMVRFFLFSNNFGSLSGGGFGCSWWWWYHVVIWVFVFIWVWDILFYYVDILF